MRVGEQRMGGARVDAAGSYLLEQRPELVAERVQLEELGLDGITELGKVAKEGLQHDLAQLVVLLHGHVASVHERALCRRLQHVVCGLRVEEVAQGLRQVVRAPRVEGAAQELRPVLPVVAVFDRGGGGGGGGCGGRGVGA